MKLFEKDLKFGDEGPLVSDLQERLIQLGFKTCFIEDGDSIGVLDEPTGFYGETTHGLVESFQAKVFDVVLSQHIGLPVVIDPNNVVTGIMDHNTHFVLQNYEKLAEWYKTTIEAEKIEIPEEEPEEVKPIVSTVIQLINKDLLLAKGELGVVEHGGNNYGDRVEEYQRIGSNGACTGGQPWCDYYQKWLLIMACKALGLPYKATYSGYTPYEVDDWGKKHGLTIKNPTMAQIEVGDWGFVYSSARRSACHIFLITGKTKTDCITNEGNTNSGGGSDGFGVFARRRMPWAIVKWHRMYE